MNTQEQVKALSERLGKRIVGQQALIDRLLIAVLANGHVLVEGAPGLAKTTAIKTLALAIEADFHRIQFTPDLLPADVIGTEIFRPQDGSFRFERGPVFHNLVLADEINRAPAKVQSALLEAMGEHQVTVAQKTYQMPKLFMVMATQNPIEQEGTHALPEAQLDRFLMYVRIGYPDRDAERQILALARGEARDDHANDARAAEPVTQETIFAARNEVLDLHMSEALETYLVELVLATRDPSAYDEKLARWIQFGASPRATIALDRCARAHAWLAGRDYVSPEDVHAIAADVLRHRVILSFEAEADGITTDHFVDELLNRVPLP